MLQYLSFYYTNIIFFPFYQSYMIAFYFDAGNIAILKTTTAGIEVGGFHHRFMKLFSFYVLKQESGLFFSFSRPQEL